MSRFVKKRAEPYAKIVGELPEMRKDAVMLIQQSVKQNRPAYVFVNNRAEGNAPQTIQGLVDAINSRKDRRGVQGESLQRE